MTTLYIAGRMSGQPEHGLPAFMEAEERLLAVGYQVRNPARSGDRMDGPVTNLSGPLLSWADYLRRDLRLVLEVDGIAVLPLWAESKGAALEVHVANTLGVPVMPVAEWVQLDGGVRDRAGGGQSSPSCPVPVTHPFAAASVQTPARGDSEQPR